MKNKKSWFYCPNPNCGSKQLLNDTAKRYWCDCYPSAPFEMHRISTRKLLDKLMPVSASASQSIASGFNLALKRLKK